jgi:dihydrofolate synthase/folylpolyglutamate synthase
MSSQNEKYQKAVEAISELNRLGSKLGLESIKELLNRLGNPEKKLKFVHVAGTNGKGSTVSMIAAALASAGYKTGMYVSPSVVDFSERIQINGEYTDKADFLNAYEAVGRVCDGMCADGLSRPTEFETVTAIALKIYADTGCDIAVLETGLGGRFDATNAIPAPEVAVITSISRDHMKLLGDTLGKIAFEKCGIIKDGCPVVTYSEQPEEALEEIKKQCALKDSPLIVPDIGALEISGVGVEGTEFSYSGRTYVTPLVGDHFAKNALTAIEALGVLRRKGYRISEKDIASGLAARPFTARMEIVSRSPYIVLDGAHNIDAVDKLCKTLDGVFPGRRIITVMGMFSDKEYDKCIPKIAEKSEIFIATEPENSRALSAYETASFARGRAKYIAVSRLPGRALRAARSFAGKDDVILCCGSFSFLGEIKEALGGISR